MKIQHVLLYILCLLCLSQCKKDTNQAVSPTQNTTVPSSLLLSDPSDLTPQEVNDEMDQLPSIHTTTDQLLLPNGQSIKNFIDEYKISGGRLGTGRQINVTTPATQKLMLIAAMGVVAERLCNRGNFQVPAEKIGTPPKDDPLAPAQNGLAYSYGQDNYKVRTLPASPPISCSIKTGCQFRLQGLDCSGFIICLLREAIDPFTNKPIFPSIARYNSKYFSLEGTWNDGILSKNEKFKYVTMKNLGSIPPADVQAGDIIYYTKGHIVFVTNKLGTQDLSVFGSNGVANENNCDAKDKKTEQILNGQCVTNYTSIHRGVHEVSATATSIQAFGPYQVLRLSGLDTYFTYTADNVKLSRIPLPNIFLNRYSTGNVGSNYLQFDLNVGSDEINLILQGFKEKPATFTVDGLTGDGDALVQYTSGNKIWGSPFNVNIGKVIITSVSNNIAVGTFEFSLPSMGYGTKSITNGAFRAHYNIRN